MATPEVCEYDIGDLYSGVGLSMSAEAIDLSASVDGLSATERSVGERMSSKSSTTPGETPQGENPATQAPEHAAADPAAGFQRGRIVWGRPPQPVFRAGPLPRDEGLARLMAMPPHPQATKTTVKGSVATGVTGGGNIPQAARGPQGAGGQSTGQSGGLGGFSNVPQRPASPTPASPALAATKPVTQTGVLGGSLVPSAKLAVAPAAVPEIAPAKTADKVEPAPQIEEDIVVMSELEPVVAPRRPHEGTAIPAAAKVTAKTASAPSWGKWAVAGGALVVAAGALFWWMSREPAVPVVPVISPASVAPETVAPDVATGTGVDAAPAAVETIAAAPAVATPPSRAVTEPARASVLTPARTTVQAPVQAPVQASVQRPTPAESAPAPVAPPVVVQVPVEAPVLEQGPPPTTAAPTQSNPDAPVVTRPQKLD